MPIARCGGKGWGSVTALEQRNTEGQSASNCAFGNVVQSLCRQFQELSWVRLLFLMKYLC